MEDLKYKYGKYLNKLNIALNVNDRTHVPTYTEKLGYYGQQIVQTGGTLDGVITKVIQGVDAAIDAINMNVDTQAVKDNLAEYEKRFDALKKDYLNAVENIVDFGYDATAKLKGIAPSAVNVDMDQMINDADMDNVKKEFYTRRLKKIADLDGKSVKVGEFSKYLNVEGMGVFLTKAIQSIQANGGNVAGFDATQLGKLQGFLQSGNQEPSAAIINLDINNL